MSQVYPLLSGWVGYGGGAELLVRENEPLDSEHPLVLERPELFTAADPPKRGQRPAARKTGPVT